MVEQDRGRRAQTRQNEMTEPASNTAEDLIRASARSAVRGLAAAIAIAAFVLPMTATQGLAQDAEAETIARMYDMKTGAMAKVGVALAETYAKHQAGAALRSLETTESSLLSSADLARVVDGKVLIDAVAAGSAAELLQDLEALGLERGSSFGRVVSGWLPVGALDAAAGLGSLQLARPAASLANVGSVTSEGDPSMGSDLARFFFGVKGRRVTIGSMSNSYDCLAGAAGDIASGDLPPADRITILDDTACPGSDEGRAMMQLIRDVAPRANQAFHTAFGGQADFANGIIELANQAGSDIVVDDVIYFAETMFQDGIIAQAVDQVKEAGVAYFSSAGNGGRNSWESGDDGFVGSGITGAFGGERHDFDPGPGVDDLQNFIVAPGTTIFAFNWDQPAASVAPGAPGSASDVDILLYLPDGTFTGIAGASFNIDGDPVEVFGIVNNGTEPLEVAIGIELFEGPAPGFMKYVVFDPRSENVEDPPTSFALEFATDSGTNYGHSNAAGAAGVGAAFWRNTPRFGVFPPRVEPFSSAGGTPILFDLDGLPVEEDREKPDFVAPDGGITTFFGGRDSFGNIDPEGTNFFGTSAAAPHAAAVAALMLEANRHLTPDDIYHIIEDTALDMDDPSTPGFDFGYDTGTGHGYISALRSVWDSFLFGDYYDDDDDDGDDIALGDDDD